MKKRIVAVLSALALLVVMFTGCSAGKRKISSAEDLNSAEFKVGTVQGPASMYITEEKFPKAQIKYYQNAADCYTALASDQLDAMVYSRCILENYAETDDKIALIDGNVGYADICVGLKKGNTEMKAKVDEFIAQAKADGTLADMEKRWIGVKDPVMPEIEKPANPVGTLRVATEGLDIPFTYFGDNGELMGYDIEFAKRLATYLNMDVSIESMSFDALFPTLNSDKADIVVNQLNVTEERKQSVMFSEPYYRSEIVVAVNKDRYEQAEKKFASLADFAGETITLPTGSALDRIVSKVIGDVNFSYTKDHSAAIESVRSGKAAAVVLDKPVAYKAAAANSELMPFPIAVETDDYAYMFPKGSEYVDKFNSALKELRESGKLAELEDYWINNPVENPVVEPQKSTGKNGTVKVTVEDDVEPMSYINGEGEVIGYDIAVCNLICDKLDIKAEYVPTSADSRVENIKSGKTDFAVGPISVTEERKQSVDFCDTTYSGAVTLLIRKDRFAQSDKKYGALADFEGEKIVVQTGTSFDKTVSEIIKNVEFVYMNDNSTGIEEVKSGKAAAVVMDKPVAYKAAAANKELVPFPIPVALEDYSYAFRKGSELVAKFNSALKQIRETGKYDELEDYWINNPPENPVIEPQKSQGKNGTLKIAVEPSIDPMTYLNGEGEVIGFDIALCNQICDILDMKTEYVIYSMDSMIQAVDSGKADLALGAISVTEERKQSVDFCDTTYSGAVTMLVRKDRVASELLDGTAGLVPFKEKMAKSRLGVVTGSLIVIETEKNFPNTEIIQFNDYGNAVEALKAGKVDYVIMSISSAKNYARHNKDLCAIDENVLNRDGGWVACAVRKGYDKLEQINEIIVRFKKDGTMDKIEQNWISETASCDKSVIPVKQDAPVWKIGVSSILEPMCYIDSEGDIVGFDAELAMRIAYELGMRVEFVNMDFSALIPALQSGKVDMLISDMGITEERLKQVDFSERYYNDGNVVLARNTEENLAYAAAASKEKAEAKNRLSGKKVGIMTGSAAVMSVENEYPDAEVVEINSISDAVEMLKAGKLDYVLSSRSTCLNFAKYNKELRVIDEEVISGDKTAAYIAINKENPELLDKINGILKRYSEDGTLAAIEKNWLGENAAYDMSGVPKKADAPVLKVGIDVSDEPMEFVLNGKNAGFDCELIERIAYELGMRVEYSNMNFPALIPALQSGKVDVVISDITATDERREMVNFTEPYYANPQVLLTRKTDEEIFAEKSGWEQFWSNFKDSFTRTFITENRWKLVLNGLGVTLIISICAFIVGSIWGGAICALLRSKRKIANIPAKVYVRLLQGTPIVVLLMILYYIVFKDFDINAIVVAIIGFALNLGAYTSQIFKTAIDSVDKGQIEAASAMGFNKFQVFMKIIFPQAARNALPVYKGEFISLVKSTSIVGYIAIQDLTKVSDIIRSRTYEAFFPLIATAIIYFVVTYIFIILLNVLEKKIDPKRRKRVVKGVDEK